MNAMLKIPSREIAQPTKKAGASVHAHPHAIRSGWPAKPAGSFQTDKYKKPLNRFLGSARWLADGPLADHSRTTREIRGRLGRGATEPGGPATSLGLAASLEQFRRIPAELLN